MFSKGFTVAILLIGFVLVANVRCAPEQVRVILFSWLHFRWFIDV